MRDDTKIMFQLKSKYKPTGDQPQAIENLVAGVKAGLEHQVLLGVTGSGKTFTVANIVEQTQKPTLVLTHNKTLAAQLFSEYQEFFPDNAVKYFVSYYDYYQPEAYVAHKDLYIEKEVEINEEIEKYRNAATQALLTRRDVIIVASVSCIYGLGDPIDYQSMARTLKVGEEYNRSKLLRNLTDLQYQRNDMDFARGKFRVKGDTLDVYLSYEDHALRVEYFGDEVERLTIIQPLTGEVLEEPTEFTIFPAKNFVTPFEKLKMAIPEIENELKERYDYYKSIGKEVEAQRIKQRVMYDVEMLREVGYVSGIENYTRFISGKQAGEAPSTLLDYFPDDFLLVVDESHMAIPQVRGMYHGDQARKKNLVEYGFRLPSAMDNRPLKFEEFEKRVPQIIYTTATPKDWELEQSWASVRKHKFTKHNGVVEQIIRPTGLLDPIVEIRPTKYQIDDLIKEIQDTTKKGHRVIVTTLTKRMAEDLSAYLEDLEIKSAYLHSEVETFDRVDILKDLRLGVYDVLIGVNLLREGIDLPEVSLVAIMDADKEGFLRSESALIQTIGRAARHSEGRVVMYADNITGSMKLAIDETRRRRKIQEEYNEEHGITPTTIVKAIKDQLVRQKEEEKVKDEILEIPVEKVMVSERDELLELLKEKMEMASAELRFEDAAEYRDKIKEIESSLGI